MLGGPARLTVFDGHRPPHAVSRGTTGRFTILTYEFDSVSYCQGFGNAGNLVFDIEGGGLTRSRVELWGLQYNPTTKRMEGTAKVHLYANDMTPVVENDSAPARVKFVVDESPCHNSPSFSKYPTRIEIDVTGPQGEPGTLVTTAVNFVDAGTCREVWPHFKLEAA